MKISIVLPLGRDGAKGQWLIDKINSDVRGDNTVQICVSSCTYYPYQGAILVKDNNVGVACAIARLFAVADGDVVAWISDTCDPEPNAFDLIADFLHGQKPPIIAEFNVGDSGCKWKGRYFARWGATTRVTIDMIGTFDEAYGAFWGDVDYSMRCWAQGGIVTVCPTARLRMPSSPRIEQDDLKKSNLERFNERDLSLFRHKWGHLEDTSS